MPTPERHPDVSRLGVVTEVPDGVLVDADDAASWHVVYLPLDGYLTISQRHEYLLLARVGCGVVTSPASTMA
ncbi:hypothetical protein GCM10009030_27540 [Haloarcula pellucida]|uniref:Uncharacterized protein n=1 Tax=Haloarcula pellucida TaxID=1427151 RepID=A0A830GPX2_9EURY|nr:hypothetical protein GCM10009030_27540 [Halomicroarcula pellucida]